MKNKFLIWLKKKELINKGGPSGYLYNLNIYFENNKIDNVHFLEEDMYKKNNKLFIESIRSFRKLIIRNKIKKRKIKLLESILEKRKLICDKLKDYELIHFHSTKDMYRCMKDIEKLKLKTILQSHSPQLASQEELEEEWNKEILIQEKEFVKKYKKYDYLAFKKADYVIFPCVEAMEPYKKDIELNKIKKKKNRKNQIKFLLTGIDYKKIEKDDEYFYKKYNIPKESIVISYIGRHNEIKGYDLLIKAGEILLRKYHNLYFIIAGKENEKIKKLSHPRWIEIGWTGEGLNIMKNCDLFILPNRETYFDLIFLELLSQNTTILCSETGGNKYFKKFNSEKIKFFEPENIESIVFEVEKLFPKLKMLKENKVNEEIYFKNFTIHSFGKNYLDLVEKIIEENNCE